MAEAELREAINQMRAVMESLFRLGALDLDEPSPTTHTLSGPGHWGGEDLRSGNRPLGFRDQK